MSAPLQSSILPCRRPLRLPASGMSPHSSLDQPALILQSFASASKAAETHQASILNCIPPKGSLWSGTRDCEPGDSGQGSRTAASHCSEQPTVSGSSTRLLPRQPSEQPEPAMPVKAQRRSLPASFGALQGDISRSTADGRGRYGRCHPAMDQSGHTLPATEAVSQIGITGTLCPLLSELLSPIVLTSRTPLTVESGATRINDGRPRI